MVYLLQVEEREISYDLLQDLAAVLTESPGVVFADAVRKIHVSYGILEFGTRAEAERVSARFADLDFRTFVVDRLLDPPQHEWVDVNSAKITDEIEVAAAAWVDTTIEHEVTNWSWLNLPRHGVRAPRPGIFVTNSDIIVQGEHVEDADLDLFAGRHHWRIKEKSAGPLLEFVKGLSLSGAVLGSGVRHLLAGNRALPRFTGEEDYDRYLKWLYQLRYAER